MPPSTGAAPAPRPAPRAHGGAVNTGHRCPLHGNSTSAIPRPPRQLSPISCQRCDASICNGLVLKTQLLPLVFPRDVCLVREDIPGYFAALVLGGQSLLEGLGLSLLARGQSPRCVATTSTTHHAMRFYGCNVILNKGQKRFRDVCKMF